MTDQPTSPLPTDPTCYGTADIARLIADRNRLAQELVTAHAHRSLDATYTAEIEHRTEKDLAEVTADRDWYRKLHEQAAGRAQRVADTAEHLIAEANAKADALTATLTEQRKISDRLSLLYLNDPGFGAGYAEAVARLRDDDRYTNWWSCSPDSVRPTVPIRGHLADYLETVGPDGPDISKPLDAQQSRADIHAETVVRITKLLGTASDSEFREAVRAAILDGRAKLSRPPTSDEVRS